MKDEGESRSYSLVESAPLSWATRGAPRAAAPRPFRTASGGRRRRRQPSGRRRRPAAEPKSAPPASPPLLSLSHPLLPHCYLAAPFLAAAGLRGWIRPPPRRIRAPHGRICRRRRRCGLRRRSLRLLPPPPAGWAWGAYVRRPDSRRRPRRARLPGGASLARASLPRVAGGALPRRRPWGPWACGFRRRRPPVAWVAGGLWLRRRPWWSVGRLVPPLWGLVAGSAWHGGFCSG